MKQAAEAVEKFSAEKDISKTIKVGMGYRVDMNVV